jgi:O-acetylserine/cysteine efflux transporter
MHAAPDNHAFFVRASNSCGRMHLIVQEVLALGNNEAVTRTVSDGRLSGGDLAAALAIVFIWGMNFIAMKYALHDFTPFQLGAARYVCAVLPLLFFVKPPRLRWKWVVLYGLFQGVGQFGFLFTAIKVGMTASLASVLMQTQVFFTAIFSYLLLRERASRPLQIGLLLAASGLACFAMNYVMPPQGVAVNAASITTAAGFALNLCAAAMWAASNIVARKAQQASSGFDPLAFVVWSSLVPIIPFMVMSYGFDDAAARSQWTHAAFSSWIAVGYLGWMATIVAYGMWTHLLKRHPANRVAPFSLGVPVVGLAAGMLWLGESITAWQWAGIVLVVLALGWVMFGERILALLFATVLAGCAAAPAAPPEGPVHALASDVWWLPGQFPPGREPDGNTVMFGGPQGLVVMDTGRHPAHREATLEFARQQRRPIAAIVNSHWHLDHTSGNADIQRAYPDAQLHTGTAVETMIRDVFPKGVRDDQALVDSGQLPPGLAEDVRLDIETRKHPQALRPDVPVLKSQTRVLGGRALELNLAPNAATDGDVWVYDTRSRIAAVGDLVTLPVPFLDTACTRGWRNALADVAAKPFVTVVPGHGAPMDRRQFDTYRTAFESFVGCAASDADAGVCVSQWALSSAPLRAPEPADDSRTVQMAKAYVALLRKNGGNGARCAVP